MKYWSHPTTRAAATSISIVFSKYFLNSRTSLSKLPWLRDRLIQKRTLGQYKIVSVTECRKIKHVGQLFSVWRKILLYDESFGWLLATFYPMISNFGQIIWSHLKKSFMIISVEKISFRFLFQRFFAEKFIVVVLRKKLIASGDLLAIEVSPGCLIRWLILH